MHVDSTWYGVQVVSRGLVWIAVGVTTLSAVSAQDPRAALSVEQRLQALEQRLVELERQGASAQDPEVAELRAAARAVATERAPAAEPGSLADAVSSLNPRMTLFSDFVYTGVHGTLRNEDGDDAGDRFAMRETELDLRADIDPYAKGVGVLAIEEEAPNEFHLAVEELYASLEGLPSGLRARAGRFRSAFGQNNLLHTHDLPHTNRPLAVRQMLGGEGDVQNGIALSWLGPAAGNAVPTLQYQLLNGENDAVLAGSASDHLAHLGRASVFVDLPPASYLELGSSVLVGYADPDAAGGETTLVGADVTYRWRPGDQPQSRSLVLQAEGFVLERPIGGEKIHSTGGYASAQYQLGRWYLGGRGDWTQFASLDRGEAWAGSGWLSYYTTEFLRLRGGVEYLDDPTQEADWLFYLQMTVVLGAHPPHPYWVNR